MKESNMERSIRETVEHIQIVLHEHKMHPPTNRSDIAAKIQEKYSNLSKLRGKKNGTNAFRLQLIDLASYLIFAASEISNHRIAHE